MKQANEACAHFYIIALRFEKKQPKVLESLELAT